MKKTVLAAIALSMLVFQSASAATVSTNVTFNLSDVIILYSLSGLEINYEGIDEAGTDPTLVINSPIQDINKDVGINVDTSPVGTIPGNVNVRLGNAWAVRGITSSGEIAVDAVITSDTGVSVLDPTSVITISGLNASSEAGVNMDPLTVTAPGLTNVAYGNIEFAVDLTQAYRSGEYDGVVYTLTASSP